MRLFLVIILVVAFAWVHPLALAQQTATVVNTGGQSLNCRDSYPRGTVIGKLAAGSTVELRGDAENGWYPVVCNGQNGWASASYLSVGAEEPSAPSPSGVVLTVVNTGGSSLNCRAAYPSGTVIASLPAGSQVEARGAQENGWWPVICGGQSGWASGDYLREGGAAPQEPQEPSGEQVTLTVVNTGGQNLNCRASYPSGTVIASLPAGLQVVSRGSQENGWWPITCGGQAGWASGEYLSTSAPEPSSDGSSDVVDYAMQYVGYPYTPAGNHPSEGFDCSGFTYWVFLNARGIDIGTGTDSQAALGSYVAWGEWQAGDLLFFVGTGGTGGYYSHVSIYIGDGQMVHAQNEATGVTTSSVYSNYYTDHYATARRL